MKKYALLPLIAAMAMLGTSCYSTHGSVNTKRSAVVGGVLGAGAGALIGEHKGRELEGAAVGGALGAIAGGVLGSARDEQYYNRQGPPYNSYNGSHQRSSYRTTGYGYGGYNSGYRSGYGRHYNHYPPSRSYHSGRGYSGRSGSYCH